MLFVVLIISLSLQCAIGTPQLRLSHTGYEIISFNEQTPDDSLPVATKLTLQNASRHNGIGVLDFEKAENIDDEADDVSLPAQQQQQQQQHKRHYDLLRSTAGSKATAEARRNMIDTSVKESSSAPSEKASVYLAVGIPTRFDHSSSPAKDGSSAFPSTEITSSRTGAKNFFQDSNREKMSTSTNRVRINDKKTKTSAKISNKLNGIQGSDKATSIFDSDFDLAEDSKDDSKLDKFTALLADAHRALHSGDAKSDLAENQDKTETKPALFPMVGKLPSIQIHRQRSFFLPSKSPAMFSPIYPSGFEIVAGNFAKKAIIPVNQHQQSHAKSPVQLDSKILKNRKYVDAEVQAQRKLLGHEINEISNGPKEFATSHQKERVPSLMILKNIISNMNHDIFNPRSGNAPLNGLLPVAATSLYVSPLSLVLQQPFRPSRPSATHLEFNSMPLLATHVDHNHSTGGLSILHPQGHLEDMISNSMIDAPKVHQLDNYLDSRFLDSKVNHRIAKSGSKAEFFKKYLGKMNSPNVHPTARSLVVNQPAKELLPPSTGSAKENPAIEVLHEAASEDSEETPIEANKIDPAKDDHEMQNAHQTPSSVAPKSICKLMKSGPPPFYQFLAKISEIVLDNALKYESSLQVQDSAMKLLAATKKTISESPSGL